ncbi:MAG TPA: hypothetical protein VHX66_07840 [Solirubrobacteraceae bacterium]|jgi:hypothetical protein|nr:hypothetical protein [Solirubrobacteraceae bacterium]
MGWLDQIRTVQWANGFATHRPVLWHIASRSTLTMLEFGCGDGSTALLHRISAERNTPLITFDTDPAWLGRYAPSMESPLHQFRVVSSWEDTLASAEWDEQRYGLVFVDQAPWEARVATVHRFRLMAEYIVLHDSDYFPTNGLMGRSIRPIVGPDDVGSRTYDDVFTSYKEFFPPEPWPLRETGPPTLLGSNFNDCAIDVDWSAFWPPSWARGPILRGHALATLAGQALRQRGRSHASSTRTP